MMHVVVAYIPVLHEGYRRFLEEHGRDRAIFVIGPELFADYRPLAKDIRCLDADLVASAIGSWGVGSEVSVLTARRAQELAVANVAITLPAEDISYRIVDRWFPRAPVSFDSVFLRWDKTRTATMLRPQPRRLVSAANAVEALGLAAQASSDRSADWWRQVGAALRFPSGEVRTATSDHLPHRLSAYTVGDPRSNFHKGVQLELSTAMHAEARLVAEAARDGIPTAGSVLYVTDFPCPPCAKLVAATGIQSLYFREGYAVLDGQDVLESAGVEIVEVVERIS